MAVPTQNATGFDLQSPGASPTGLRVIVVLCLLRPWGVVLGLGFSSLLRSWSVFCEGGYVFSFLR